MHEIISRLRHRHHVELFSLGALFDQFCCLNSIAHDQHQWEFQPLPLFSSPWGRLTQLQRLRDLRRLSLLEKEIASHIDGMGFDVVFANPCRITQAPLLLRYARTPSVYLCHEIPRPLYEPAYRAEDEQTGFRRALDRIDPIRGTFLRLARHLDAAAVRSAGLVLTNSKFSQNLVRATYGISPRLLYMGVDADRFSPSPLTAREGYFLSVGAIHPRKGFDFLIRAIGSLPPDKRRPLQLVGDSEAPHERDRLFRLAAELEVQLRMAVGVSDDALIDHYRRAALMLYSPHREPLGMAPLEAFSCQLAVLGVDEAGVKETIPDRVCGRLVRRDIDLFAATLMEMMDAPELLAAWGELGRKEVLNRWNWENVVEQLDARLHSVKKNPSEAEVAHRE